MTYVVGATLAEIVCTLNLTQTSILNVTVLMDILEVIAKVFFDTNKGVLRIKHVVSTQIYRCSFIVYCCHKERWIMSTNFKCHDKVF